MKARHSWGEEKECTYTTTQECISCGLFRFKVMRFWQYSWEQVADDNPFVDTIGNDGCGSTLKEGDE